MSKTQIRYSRIESQSYFETIDIDDVYNFSVKGIITNNLTQTEYLGIWTKDNMTHIIKISKGSIKYSESIINLNKLVRKIESFLGKFNQIEQLDYSQFYEVIETIDKIHFKKH